MTPVPPQSPPPPLPCARGDFLWAICDEVNRMYRKHGTERWGRHEFYGILKEEFDELWDAIKQNQPYEALMAELVQVAAVCVRFAESGDRYDRRPPPPVIIGDPAPAPTQYLCEES